MIGDKLFNDNFWNEITSENPNFEKIKRLIIQAYNQETGSNLVSDEIIAEEQEKQIVIWLNRLFIEHPNGHSLFLQKKQIILPFISADLSQKINHLSQFHCPICSYDQSVPIRIIPIRISAISKQAVANKSRKRRAFEKAIKHRLSRLENKYARGEKLCIHIVFILGKTNRDKDLDNMSKALLDALKKVLFSDDLDIEHLNLMKIKWSGEEDYITINIRKSALHKHTNVIFNSMHHEWAGEKFLELEEFM